MQRYYALIIVIVFAVLHLNACYRIMTTEILYMMYLSEINSIIANANIRATSITDNRTLIRLVCRSTVCLSPLYYYIIPPRETTEPRQYHEKFHLRLWVYYTRPHDIIYVSCIFRKLILYVQSITCFECTCSGYILLKAKLLCQLPYLKCAI